MKIINKTNLSYKEIGEIIDEIISTSKGNTNYVGKIEVGKVLYNGKPINITIRYLKKIVEWRFDYEKWNNRCSKLIKRKVK